MKKVTWLIPIILLNLIFPVIRAQDSHQKLYRIHIEDFSRIRSIETMGITVFDRKPGSWIDVMATPEQMENLQIEGAETEFLADSFRELYRYQLLQKTSPPWHDYDSTNAELCDIAARYPDITRLDTIGYSVLGRAICCLKISDHPEIDEDEPPLLFVANHHGNEIHSIEAVFYQINYLVDGYGKDPEVTGWIDSLEIWYVPLVNPDGREAMERANNHGVDLNRNYSVGFTPGGGHGTEAFSEPETRAIRDLTERYPPVMSLTYHTSGQYVLHSWTHTDAAAPDSSALIYVGTRIAESIPGQSGSGEEHYTLLQGGRWYFTAGEYNDYLYATHNTLAYTIEMGTSQAADYSVVPEMVQSNLEGMKTLLRQANRAGVTGRVTDRTSGLPVAATINIPAIDNQDILLPRLADSLYGRYYRYLEPGTCQFVVTAPGYRMVQQEVLITADSLTHWDIPMERAADIQFTDVTMTDIRSGQTTGNGDGRVNPGERIGITFTLTNNSDIDASGIYVKAQADNPYLTWAVDSLFFGDMEGGSIRVAPDTLLCTIDPSCPDGAILDISFSIGDTEGTAWTARATYEVYAPALQIRQIRINDESGNGNGIWDIGETVWTELQVANAGRQDLQDLTARIETAETCIEIMEPEAEAENLNTGQACTLAFQLRLREEAPKASLFNLTVSFASVWGFATEMPVKLDNINGFYDDFESGENGWTHASYGTTLNLHDDWQLGEPMGKAGDPDHAWSGTQSWGTDMGWDSYQGSSWDGYYQHNVHNYLRSPVINCSGWSDTGLKFMRELNLRVQDYGRIRVNETIVWQSPASGIQDAGWVEQIIDISDLADDNSGVTITFELQSNSNGALGGWNLDDVMVVNGLMAGSSPVVNHLQPEEAVLFAAFPNPFSQSTKTGFSLAVAGQVELGIFSLSGLRIKTLRSDYLPPGEYPVQWDGTNDHGQAVPPGIYVCRLTTRNTVLTQKVIRN